MIGVILSVFVFWKLPAGTSWIALLAPFMLIGFFIYGPQALLGICAAQHATNRASATANGILGIFGYASTVISGVGFGFVADHYGWEGTYLTVVIAAIVTVGVLATIWSAKATGYEE
jgi:OPA family glycerol-3-phosphate transporter-like MFS transporter/OPA family sugar phosphate sensor protein UhpC-like MFS transporter